MHFLPGGFTDQRAVSFLVPACRQLKPKSDPEPQSLSQASEVPSLRPPLRELARVEQHRDASESLWLCVSHFLVQVEFHC